MEVVKTEEGEEKVGERSPLSSPPDIVKKEEDNADEQREEDVKVKEEDEDGDGGLKEEDEVRGDARSPSPSTPSASPSAPQPQPPQPPLPLPQPLPTSQPLLLSASESGHKTSAFSPPAARLFQPFLPAGAVGNGNNSSNDGSPPPPQRCLSEQQQQLHEQQQQQQQLQRQALPFSIDNILRPGFGQSLFLHRVAAAAAAVAAAQKSAVAAAAAAAAAAGAPGPGGALFQPDGGGHHIQRPLAVPAVPAISSPSPSSPSPSPSNGLQMLSQDVIKREPAESPPNQRLSGGGGGGGGGRSSSNNNVNSPHKPVDLSSKQIPGVGSGEGHGHGGDGGSAPEDKDSKGKDGDVPPGMVRGPNGQLWPAWVFCTRYSDRPSSGKSKIIYLKKAILIYAAIHLDSARKNILSIFFF